LGEERLHSRHLVIHSQDLDIVDLMEWWRNINFYSSISPFSNRIATKSRTVKINCPSLISEVFADVSVIKHKSLGLLRTVGMLQSRSDVKNVIYSSVGIAYDVHVLDLD
jgi:hypothetical protein